MYEGATNWEYKLVQYLHSVSAVKELMWGKKEESRGQKDVSGGVSDLQ